MKSRIVKTFLVLLCSLALLSIPAAARSGPATEAWDAADSTLTGHGVSGHVNVLVWLEPDANRGPLRAFTQRRGGHVHHEYTTVLPDVVNLRNIPLAAVGRLERIPGVVRVEPDQFHEMAARLDESVPLIRGLQSQLADAGVVGNGTDVRICVVDTGIDTDHQMYAARIDLAAGRDFVNGDNDPEDDHGHGAHVAGIAAGGTGLTQNLGCEGDEPFQGVAPAATLVGVKVLNSAASGSDSDILAGIDYCADQSASGGRADVMLLSLGTGEFAGACDHAWAVAANNAVANGVVAVASAGNEGYEGALASPACGAEVIAVGATYKDSYPNCEDSMDIFTQCYDFFCNEGCTDGFPTVDSRMCSSNQSTLLDVVAPGSVILSASKAFGGTEVIGMSGTSQAAAHVAGLAALLLDADPSLTPAQVRQVIRDGAIDLGSGGLDMAFGYGRIDVVHSLSLVNQACGDGSCDVDEDSCNCPQDCGDGPASEAVCDDNADDDCDFLVDCDDPDCAADASCTFCGNGVCDGDEDCFSCSLDCFAEIASSCGDGLCEAGNGEDCLSCPADCNGKQSGKPSNRFCCGDGDGQNPVPCSDSRCSAGGWQCTEDPTIVSCCGDAVCEGSEDPGSCLTDCEPCLDDVACDNGDACTIDSCVGGECASAPLDCDDGDACTADGCADGACFHDVVSCDDGDACTVDSCDAVNGCQNESPACGLADGCCGDGCDDGNDPDCPSSVCGDGVCDGNGEDCYSCPTDCRCKGKNCAKACCGDGVCSGESKKSCPADCS